MLVQMPRGSSDQPGTQKAEECSAFEAGLRRDLATAPVVSYEAMLGGWSKRAIEFTLTLIGMLVWLPAMLVAALVAKLRHPAPVFVTHERIGYGGRAFKCYSMRLSPPTAVIERLHPEEPANDWNSIAEHAEDGREKWRRSLERLPRLFNVLRGEMALVGPAPLGREDLEPLKTAKRYYLSMRPGVIGISSVADADDEHASQYKIYAMAWSHLTDFLIMWDAMQSLRTRGELWKPTRRVLKRKDKAPVQSRRRVAAE